ncbi:hypothetical protein OPV22_007748 [Ensete ventricosum]|uniref:OB domain-containing protein n=1 Tax=Ensete ventricosum TaxID=4639 RepID=A0AAV8Q7Y9_ENSVE|nr:hypothetical protein OPV22_007748 [Ensete ventricosum]
MFMSSPANAVVISSDQAMKRTQHCSSRVFALTASEGFTYDDDRTERRGKEAELSSKEEYSRFFKPFPVPLHHDSSLPIGSVYRRLRLDAKRFLSSMAKMVHLKDIVPAATNTVNTQFIVLEKGSIARDGKEMTCLALVADETASVHFQMWGSECEAFEPGDILRLSNGIFSFHKNSLVLRAGKKGNAEKVGEFTMLFVETPNMSEIRWARDPCNPKKFVQEAVLSPHSRIFAPSQ